MSDDARIKALIVQGVLYRMDVLAALHAFPANPVHSLGMDLIGAATPRGGAGLSSLLIQTVIGSLVGTQTGLKPLLKGALWGFGLGALATLFVMDASSSDAAKDSLKTSDRVPQGTSAESSLDPMKMDHGSRRGESFEAK